MNQATLAASSRASRAFMILGAGAGRGMVSECGAGPDFGASFRTFAAMRHASHGRAAKPVTVMSRADFVHHVALHLPDVSARIEEDDFGILHLEMGAMKLATRDAIERYELHSVRRHFAFIAYLYEHADDALHDAIVVSYLEPLFVRVEGDEYAHARSLLPASLADVLRRSEHRYDLLGAAWSMSPQRRAPDPISLTLY